MTAKLRISAIKPYPVWVGTRNQMLVNHAPDVQEHMGAYRQRATGKT